MAGKNASSSILTFCELWANSLASIIGQLGVSEAAGSFTFHEQENSPPAAGSADGVATRFTAGGSLRGEILCYAETPAALQLAQTLMAEPRQPNVAFTDDYKDAFAELVRQAAGVVTTGWKAATGSEIVLTFHPAIEPAFPAAPSAQITLNGKDFAELQFGLWLNSTIIQAIEAQGAGESPSASHDSTALPSPLPESVAQTGNLDLLLDVELDATIRFGEREMLLRDVLGLMPGTVVELNQLVNEPADLLVAGRLVARGEVVVVDGNFGLRVTEVASKTQRAALVPF